MKLLKCPNCYGYIKDTSDNCKYCNTELFLTSSGEYFSFKSVSCPQCNFLNDGGVKCCSECKTLLIKNCISCGFETIASASLCGNCGANINYSVSQIDEEILTEKDREEAYSKEDKESLDEKYIKPESFIEKVEILETIISAPPGSLNEELEEEPSQETIEEYIVEEELEEEPSKETIEEYIVEEELEEEPSQETIEEYIVEEELEEEPSQETIEEYIVEEEKLPERKIIDSPLLSKENQFPKIILPEEIKKKDYSEERPIPKTDNIFVAEQKERERYKQVSFHKLTNPIDLSLVLLVDDDMYISKMVKQLLKADGFEVITVFSAKEALEVLKIKRPFLIISDIMMPEMDGNQFLKEIMRRPELSGIRVVMLTALSEFDQIRKSLDMGAYDYLTKPFEPEKLSWIVKNVLAEHIAWD